MIHDKLTCWIVKYTLVFDFDTAFVLFMYQYFIKIKQNKYEEINKSHNCTLTALTRL